MAATTADQIPENTRLDEESKDKPAPVKNIPDALKLFLSYPSPWIIGSIALASVSMRVWLGGFGMWDAAIAVAIFAFWPVQEWLIHVFILHFKPFEIGGHRIDMHLAQEHRAHHRKPWIVPKIFVPIRTVILGTTLGLPLFLIAWTSVLPMSLGLTAVAVFFSLGIVYEWTHYIVHTSYKPKSALYKRLWRNHRLHHFKNENYWYGVTRLEGDMLLGTAPEPGEVEKSTTVRSIV